MLIIETNVGNFGSHKDLLRFMKEESIKEVYTNVKYCTDVVCLPMWLSIEDIEEIVNS